MAIPGSTNTLEAQDFNVKEFALAYERELADLTLNSRPIIHSLTEIAGEGRQAANEVVSLIKERLNRAPMDQKLPCLYLIDSICKNEPYVYVELFSKIIEEVFISTYKSIDEAGKVAMIHLRNTWNDVFHPTILSNIDVRVQQVNTGGYPAAPARSHQIHVNPRMLDSASTTAGSRVDRDEIQRVLERSRAMQLQRDTHAGRSFDSYDTHYTGQRSSGYGRDYPYYERDSRSAYPYQNYPPHDPRAAPSQDPRAVPYSHSSVPYIQPPPQLQPQIPASAPQPDLMQLVSALAGIVKNVVRQNPPPATSAVIPLPVAKPSPAVEIPPVAHLPIIPELHKPTTTLQSNTAYNREQPVTAPVVKRTARFSIGTQFTDEALRCREQSLVDSLYDDLPKKCTSCGLRFLTTEEQNRHLDWHFKLNRIQNEKNMGKLSISRVWYLKADDWVTFEGLEAVEKPVVPFFGLSNQKPELRAAEVEEVVLADESNDKCAVCGEHFSQVWDDKGERWLFTNARRMDDPALLCHTKCYSVAHTNGDLNLSSSYSYTFSQSDTENNEENDPIHKRERSDKDSPLIGENDNHDSEDEDSSSAKRLKIDNFQPANL